MIIVAYWNKRFRFTTRHVNDAPGIFSDYQSCIEAKIIAEKRPDPCCTIDLVTTEVHAHWIECQATYTMQIFNSDKKENMLLGRREKP